MTNCETGGSKKDEIIDVASALFSLKGYKATTIENISNRVSLHKTSLFHYFKNKEEILMAVMDKSLNEHLNILSDIANDPNVSGEVKLKLALERQISTACKYRDHINVYLSEITSLSPKNRKRYREKRKEHESFFEKIVKEIQADGRSRLFKGLDPKIVKLGILGMCNWIIKWYDDNGPSTPTEIYSTFHSIITGSPIDSAHKGDT